MIASTYRCTSDNIETGSHFVTAGCSDLILPVNEPRLILYEEAVCMMSVSTEPGNIIRMTVILDPVTLSTGKLCRLFCLIHLYDADILGKLPIKYSRSYTMPMDYINSAHRHVPILCIRFRLSSSLKRLPYEVKFSIS